jgi:hypothetical protein
LELLLGSGSGSGSRNLLVFFCLVSQQSFWIILSASFLPSFPSSFKWEYYFSDHSNSFRAKCKTTSPNISVTKSVVVLPKAENFLSTHETHCSIGGAKKRPKKGLIFCLKESIIFLLSLIPKLPTLLRWPIREFR